MNLLIVGGSFDDNGGKASGLITKLATQLSDFFDVLTVRNGGNYKDIESIIELAKDHEAVLWFANVPNDKPKIRDVKSVNPKTILVTSKRNVDGKYTFAELLNRALEQKANLCVEFVKGDTAAYGFRLFDPLGNEWYAGEDIKVLSANLAKKIKYLAGITRQGTIHIESSYNVVVPDENEFFAVIKDYAEVFHSLINPAKEVTRFLGNSSFRCTKGGFPSFRMSENMFFVSKRNIDKRYIDKDGFVPVIFEDNEINYFGDSKPSVDTPIQVRLYKALPKINYMIHSHVYIKGAPFTKNMVPCGGLEEVQEVLSAIGPDKNRDFYAVNLIGHGSIVMSSDVRKLKEIDYVGRKFPERIKSSIPVGRIEYLSSTGKVSESVEYSDETNFIRDIKEQLYYGVPLIVVLYEDENGKTISRQFLKDIDTMPRGLITVKMPKNISE